MVGLLSSCNFLPVIPGGVSTSEVSTSVATSSTSEATSTSEESSSTSEATSTSNPTSIPTSESTSDPTSEITSESTSIPTSEITSEPTSEPTSIPTSESSSEEQPYLDSITFSETPTVAGGDLILDKLYTTISKNYSDGNSESYKYTPFNKISEFDFSLFINNQEVDIDDQLLANTSYKLVATSEGVSGEVSFTTDSSVKRLNREDLAIKYRDFRYIDNEYDFPYYPPAEGNVNVLVIPVKLSGSWTVEWNEEDLENFSNHMFGDNPLSFKSYYEDASFGAMEVSGYFSQIYEETEYTSDIIQNNPYYLYYMMYNAVEYIENNTPHTNFAKFDNDNDGCLDNVHIITNFSPDLYEQETGQSAWSTSLWPHMSMTGWIGTHSHPSLNAYSLDDIIHLREQQAIAPIHEQGHIFGLQDYYDYNFEVDYIGSADMQSSNVFDWNSFSKLGVGWVSPYVVQDECIVTLDAASINGDCLIIPADPETFNNSAFDEYFLIELFSMRGNNAKFFEEYNETYPDANLDYGVRFYHVDARLINEYGRETDDPLKGSLGCDNNAYDYPYHPVSKLADYKLLTLIQQEGIDSFGSKDWWARKYLTDGDLFHQGDVFKFEDYSYFLSKQGKEMTTMDNGEEFPYTIKFLRMDDEKVTIKISKE